MTRSKLVQILPLVGAVLAHSALQWTPRNPVTGTSEFVQVVWDGQRCVAASETGDIVVSATCDSWTRVASPTSAVYAMAGSGNPQHPLTLLSDNQYLYRSEDGSKWTRDSLIKVPSGDSVRVNIGVFRTAQGFGTFMGTDTAMYFASTADAKAWSFTRIDAPNPHSYTACSPTVTLLHNSAGMLRSADGLHWEPSSSDTFNLGYKSVVWFKTQFVATTAQGTLLTSPDGLVWTRRDDLRAAVVDDVSTSNPPDTSWASWKQAAVFDGELILVSARNVFRTRDLAVWTKDSTMLPLTTKVPFFDQYLFPVGSKLAMTNQGAAIYVTSDLKSWTNSIGTVTTSDLLSVAGGGSRWVAVGAGGTLVHSKDGVRWNLASTGTSADLSKVVWTGKSYKAIGDSGRILSSTDGESWVAGSIGDSRRLHDIFWSDSMQLIVGDSNRIYQSTDGAKWDVKALSVGNDLSRIRASPSRWMVTGKGRALHTSTDGKTWTSATAPVDVTVPVWTGSIFLYTPGFSVYSSVDGQSWKSYKSNIWSSDGDVADLEVTQGLVLLVRPTGTVAVLAHDTEWVSLGNGTGGGINKIGLSDSLWIQVGQHGAIQTSPAARLEVGILRRAASSRPTLVRVGNQVVFGIPRQGSVRLEAWSLRGQKMATLVEGLLTAGEHGASISGLPHAPVLLRLSSPSGSVMILTVP